MSVNCQIKFNHFDKIYSPGDNLSGLIEIEVVEKIKFKRIFLVIDGSATIKWREMRALDCGSKNPYYLAGKEEYLNLDFNLMGNEDESEILPGHYSFNFACSLATNLPSSMTETHGKVLYEAIVTINCPSEADLTFPFEFLVIRPLDLNRYPILKIPIQQEVTENFCCLYCKSDPILISATLLKTGFIPGESLTIPIKLTNPTNIRIQHVEVSLLKCVEYHCQRPYKITRREERCKYKISTGDPIKNGSATYEVLFTFPHCVPSSERNQERIIKISYEMQIKAMAEGYFRGPEIKFPITIGTIPLSSTAISHRGSTNISLEDDVFSISLPAP